MSWGKASERYVRWSIPDDIYEELPFWCQEKIESWPDLYVKVGDEGQSDD